MNERKKEKATLLMMWLLAPCAWLVLLIQQRYFAGVAKHTMLVLTAEVGVASDSAVVLADGLIKLDACTKDALLLVHAKKPQRALALVAKDSDALPNVAFGNVNRLLFLLAVLCGSFWHERHLCRWAEDAVVALALEVRVATNHAIVLSLWPVELNATAKQPVLGVLAKEAEDAFTAVALNCHTLANVCLCHGLRPLRLHVIGAHVSVQVLAKVGRLVLWRLLRLAGCHQVLAGRPKACLCETKLVIALSFLSKGNVCVCNWLFGGGGEAR